MTAPVPLAPNWGGQAQFFGGDRTAGSIFGYQRLHDEAEESSSSGAAGTAAEVNGVVPAESSGAHGAEEAEMNGSAAQRGSRAATVEEAQDDDDER